MQVGLAITQCLEGQDRIEHVFTVGTGTAMTLPNEMQPLRKCQPPGILYVAAIDDEAQGPHLPPRPLFKLDPPHGFEIDGGDLLSLAQIGDSLRARRGGDAKGDPAAHAAAVEAEYQARLLGRATVNERI